MNGELKIRKGNDTEEPMVVHVSHYNSTFDKWVTDKLNTGQVILTNEEDLIEYNYKQFKILYYKWQISKHDTLKNRFMLMLNEIIK